MRIFGRAAETAACMTKLTGTLMPVGILIAGDPGIGKTLVHRTVLAMAAKAGWRVLSTTGLPSEATVPLANLADLLELEVGPVLDRLPAAQADVLRGALRLTSVTEPPDPALVVRATIGVLRDLSRQRVLIALDDEQWVDADTRNLLGTVAARLTDLPIAWLVTSRRAEADGALCAALAHELGTELLRLQLSGLSQADLTRLILDRFPARWSPGLLRQIADLAQGNPYTALEIARQTAADTDLSRTAVRIPAGLTESLRARLGRLDPQTLAVAQAASLAPQPTRSLLRRLLGDSADTAIDAALEEDLFTCAAPAPVLQFTHPLLRDATRQTMSPLARRRLHRALAAAVDDPDEAAGHLAAGAEEPNENLAGIVAAASGRMLALGAPARAAVLAESAAALTPDRDGPLAWRRRLLQFECLKRASEWERCQNLAQRWLAEIPASLRGELLVLYADMAGDFETSAALMAEAIRQLPQDDLRVAQMRTLLSVFVGINLLRLEEGHRIAIEAVTDARRSRDPVMVRNALGTEAFLAHCAGDPAAERRIRAATALPGLEETPSPYDSPEMCLGWWHMSRGEVDAARRLFRTVYQASERCGSEEGSIGARIHLAEIEWRAGRWDTAGQYGADLERYVRETGYQQPGTIGYIVALHAAAVGDVDRARSVATAGLQGAEAQQDLAFAAQCRFVLGHLELSLDDPAAAVNWLDPLARRLRDQGFLEPGLFPFPPDLIEAYARAGRIDEAQDSLARLRLAAERLDHPWARVTADRAAAVVNLARRNPEAALPPATAALSHARHLGLPFELGRCLLVLGTVQRRLRHRRDAARTLDEAIAMFSGLGARCWIDLAQAQRGRLAHTADQDLTPTEQRIALLAARGATNTEIAADLQLSTKTVEANLTRIYRKLGIRSRTELAGHQLSNPG